jgi:hypothetical protein
MREPSRNRRSSPAPSKGARLKRQSVKPPRASEHTAPATEGLGRLQAENEALQAEVERLRARYERAVEPPKRTKKAPPEPKPEPFALVGPGKRKPDRPEPSDDALDSVGDMLCRLLEERQPGTQWRYYRDEFLVPDGVTFFYAHEALRKMWGNTGGNPDPPTPQAFRRSTAAERDERHTVFSTALSRVDDALRRSQSLYAEGYHVSAVGLLKYVDLLLARFNLALAQSRAGNTDWQKTLNDPERDAKFEAWVSRQAPTEE